MSSLTVAYHLLYIVNSISLCAYWIVYGTTIATTCKFNLFFLILFYANVDNDCSMAFYTK